MSGRHRAPGKPSVGLVALIGILVALLASVLASGTANAATATVDAQLSLSGVVTQSNPIGGSVVGVHPGDKVVFSASTAPTAGLKTLGLDGLVSGLPGKLTTFQVTADFSHLPGGNAKTVLKGSTRAAFSFPTAGIYNFTFTAENVTLLGAIPINLDGNQLAAAGIKLNAENQYVGQVVVADAPPAGGISVQLPQVKASPSVPVLGQLPTVTVVPQVSVPTLPVPTKLHGGLDGLLPKPKPSSSAPVAGAPTTSAAVAGAAYTPAPVTIPELVVPTGNGVVPDFRAGLDPLNLDGYSLSAHGLDAWGSSPAPQVGTTDAGNVVPTPTQAQEVPAVDEKQIELAGNPAPTEQLPVLVAIIAILALATVTALYSRLYLLNRR